MAKTPFELHISVYQLEDHTLQWNAYYRHYSRDEIREGAAGVDLDPASIGVYADALLVSLCVASGLPFLPTIRLRTPATPEGPKPPSLF